MKPTRTRLSLTACLLLPLAGCGKAPEPPEQARMVTPEASKPAPSARAAGSAAPASPAAPAASAVPLPAGAFRVEWGALPIADTLAPGSSTNVEVTVKNLGTVEWPDRNSVDPKAAGAYAVRMGYRWVPEAKPADPAPYTDNRSELPHPVLPGEQVIVNLAVVAPKTPGRYSLQIDLVQELVTWFAAKGCPRLTKTITVK